MDYTILIVEDDEGIIELLKLYLENEKYKVIKAINGIDAVNIMKNNKINLAVVDIMMPKMNGYSLIKHIRQDSNIPILIISAKDLDSDKILGLDLGADDYISKPFNPLEVVARIKSLLRRCYNFSSTNDDKYEDNINKIITLGELKLNTENLTLHKNNEEIVLTLSEYKIIHMLMKSPGRIFTKLQIAEAFKGDYYISDDNTIMVHISKLREKIEEDPKNPKYIKTIRGVGYKIEKA